jgi:hypothetical protein
MSSGRHERDTVREAKGDWILATAVGTACCSDDSVQARQSGTTLRVFLLEITNVLENIYDNGGVSSPKAKPLGLASAAKIRG